MIKRFKSPVLILIYLLVLLGGISIFFMLSVEFREAKLLLENNQQLMRNTIVKTLTSNISDKLAGYPISSSSIDSNWNKLPLNFMANHKGQWIFPKRFSGEQKNSISTLWKYYELDRKPDNEANDELNTESASNSKKLALENISNESKLRIKALRDVKLALKADDQLRIVQQVKNYFSLVENYQLPVLEEIISSLRFLQLEKNARWNSELIQLITFQGSSQITPLVDYIFKHNEKLSNKDVERSIEKIQIILENSNINASWFNQSARELWAPNLALNVNSLKNYSIIQNKWISVRTSEDLMLFLPFSTDVELEAVENTLKSQGILDNNDSLSISNALNDGVIKTVAELSFDIQRDAWRKQAEQQDYFFMIKIALTLTFIISLFIVVAFVSYKNKKKAEFIDLRENFINLVSHELKTPLASIRIMIETLQKRNDKNLSIKDYPDKIVSEVDRLWLMVDNLLSLNQIKSGELELNIDKVNLSSLIERVYEKFCEHQSSKLVFKNSVPEDCFNFVDPLLFELVIINLFSNSIKYCDKSEVKVEISFIPQKNTLIFLDNACGIKQADWNRVFDDFYRDTSTNSKQGTGVGLSLCRQIMKVHQGTITIKDSNKSGTSWAIELPGVDKTTKGTELER